jgi:hypothetical protein
VEETDEASDDGGVRQDRRELRQDNRDIRQDRRELRRTARPAGPTRSSRIAPSYVVIGASFVRTFATAGTTGAICGRISASSPATCDSRGSLPPGSRE